MAGTTKAKTGYGREIYEDWMDYRGIPNSQRSNSIISRGDLAKSQTMKRFQLHNAYAESVVSSDKFEAAESDRKKHEDLPDNQQNKQQKRGDDSKNLLPRGEAKKVQNSGTSSQSAKNYNKKLINATMVKSIIDDFGPFYEWITNGRNDDINETSIKQLLFRK